ncbi:MAG: hypothetical protein LBK42_03715 [Propionibacteriaceae bacterium]|jgi:hypothetical protein|nr:hypothetical protein [Propionibacteriaceae bacterium]
MRGSHDGWWIAAIVVASALGLAACAGPTGTADRDEVVTAEASIYESPSPAASVERPKITCGDMVNILNATPGDGGGGPIAIGFDQDGNPMPDGLDPCQTVGAEALDYQLIMNASDGSTIELTVTDGGITAVLPYLGAGNTTDDTDQPPEDGATDSPPDVTPPTGAASQETFPFILT